MPKLTHMKKPKFELHRSKNGQFYFVLKSKNKKVIATSETYKSKSSCVKGINSVFLNAGLAVVIDKTK